MLKKYTSWLWGSPTVTTWIVFGVRIGGLVLLTPLVLTKLTSAEIAVWYLFSSVISLGNLADLGFSPTFTRLVAFVMGGMKHFSTINVAKQEGKSLEPSWELMKRLYRTMGAMYLLLSALVIIVLSIFGSWAVNKSINELSLPADGWYAWVAVLLSVSIAFYGSRWSSTLRGLNLVTESNRASILSGFCAIMGGVISLYFGGRLFTTVLTYQALSASSVFLQRYQLLNSRYIEFKNFQGLALDREVLAAAWPAAWRSGIGIGLSTGVTSVFGVIYAQIGQVTMLASFLFTARMMNLVSSLSQAPFYSKNPRFAQLRAAGKLDELARLSSRAIEFSLGAYLLGFACLLIAGEPLLRLLGANASLLDSNFLLAWGAVYLLERHHAMHAQIYSTTNRIPFYVPIAISGVVNLAIAIAYVKSLGVWAFVIGHAFSNLLINNWWSVKISLCSLPPNCRRQYLRPAIGAGAGFVLIALIKKVVDHII